MRRTLVLFAREPNREARAKGFNGTDGAGVFASFAHGWREAARSVGARLVVAAPPEDRIAWRRCLGADFPWIPQTGVTFGHRLENAAREAAAYGGQAVVVGGDVVPDGSTLAAAFTALESGADAVLAPTPDGGVSLLGLARDDLLLLRAVAPRRRDVFSRLRSGLVARGRRVAVATPAPDVNRRRDLRALIASTPGRGFLRAAVRCALVRPTPARVSDRSSSPLAGHPAPACLRGPPAAA